MSDNQDYFEYISKKHETLTDILQYKYILTKSKTELRKAKESVKKAKESHTETSYAD